MTDDSSGSPHQNTDDPRTKVYDGRRGSPTGVDTATLPADDMTLRELEWLRGVLDRPDDPNRDAMLSESLDARPVKCPNYVECTEIDLVLV